MDTTATETTATSELGATSVSSDVLDLRQRLIVLWEETTWKAAVYEARARVAHRDGYAAVAAILTEAGKREGRYASILAEILFADYVKDTSYNVQQTIARETDAPQPVEVVVIADALHLEPLARLVDELLASRQATAQRLRDAGALLSASAGGT